MRKLIVKLMYVVWAVSQLKEPTSYDQVIYEGEKRYIKYGNPHWKIDGISQQVKSSEFKIVRGLKRDWRVFKQRYSFQMSSWYRIDTWNKPIFRRISYKNSSNISFT